MSFIEIRQLAA